MHLTAEWIKACGVSKLALRGTINRRHSPIQVSFVEEHLKMATEQAQQHNELLYCVLIVATDAIKEQITKIEIIALGMLSLEKQMIHHMNDFNKKKVEIWPLEECWAIYLYK